MRTEASRGRIAPRRRLLSGTTGRSLLGARESQLYRGDRDIGEGLLRAFGMLVDVLHEDANGLNPAWVFGRAGHEHIRLALGILAAYGAELLQGGEGTPAGRRHGITGHDDRAVSPDPCGRDGRAPAGDGKGGVRPSSIRNGCL